jgi:hypothetical protein
VPPHLDFLLVEMGLVNFLPTMMSMHDPPDLYLLSSWDYKHESLCLTRQMFLNTDIVHIYHMKIYSALGIQCLTIYLIICNIGWSLKIDFTFKV